MGSVLLSGSKGHAEKKGATELRGGTEVHGDFLIRSNPFDIDVFMQKSLKVKLKRSIIAPENLQPPKAYKY